MSSVTDYYQSLSGLGMPLYSQGQGQNLSVDPLKLNSLVTDPIAIAKPGVPSAMPSGMGYDANAGTGGGFMDTLNSILSGAIGTKEAPGWGGMALGGASAIMSGIMGMKQYGLAKDALAENKRQFALNYDAQKATTNTQLQDRQRARVASNAGAYQSVGDYMNQNGIK